MQGVLTVTKGWLSKLMKVKKLPLKFLSVGHDFLPNSFHLARG